MHIKISIASRTSVCKRYASFTLSNFSPAHMELRSGKKEKRSFWEKSSSHNWNQELLLTSSSIKGKGGLGRFVTTDSEKQKFPRPCLTLQNRIFIIAPSCWHALPEGKKAAFRRCESGRTHEDSPGTATFLTHFCCPLAWRVSSGMGEPLASVETLCVIEKPNFLVYFNYFHNTGTGLKPTRKVNVKWRPIFLTPVLNFA